MSSFNFGKVSSPLFAFNYLIRQGSLLCFRKILEDTFISFLTRSIIDEFHDFRPFHEINCSQKNNFLAKILWKIQLFAKFIKMRSN